MDAWSESINSYGIRPLLSGPCFERCRNCSERSRTSTGRIWVCKTCTNPESCLLSTQIQRSSSEAETCDWRIRWPNDKTSTYSPGHGQGRPRSGSAPPYQAFNPASPAAVQGMGTNPTLQPAPRPVQTAPPIHPSLLNPAAQLYQTTPVRPGSKKH
jgi:hypothetical protein